MDRDIQIRQLGVSETQQHFLSGARIASLLERYSASDPPSPHPKKSETITASVTQKARRQEHKADRK